MVDKLAGCSNGGMTQRKAEVLGGTTLNEFCPP